jgi:inorganic triphosphatase YgiF
MAGPIERIVRDQMRGEPKEVEAKFLVRDPAVLGRLARLRFLGPFRLKSSRLELQENRYLDTEDLRLRQARAVLKTRRSGARSEITFKREISHRGGVSERIEVTSRLPVGTTYLDPSRYVVPVEPVRRARKITGSRPLREILNLRTRRRSLIFAAGREKVELDLDRVEVRRGEKTVARFSEIELENLTAQEENFMELLASIKRSFRGRLRASRVPKVEMGLRLLKKEGLLG